MFYIDTSVLVSALTHELASPKAQSWINSQKPGMIAISDWVSTEFSAALSIKLRTGQIQAPDRVRALAKFKQLREGSFLLYPISSLYFQRAADFADNFALGIRAADALHLAIANANAATLVTFDRKLLTTAAALGIPAISP